MQADRDLTILHGDARFEELVVKVQKTLDKLEQGLPIKHNSLAIIELPEPAYDSDTSIEKALKERRSIRKYKDKPLSLSEISQILWAAYGITKPIKDAPAFLRGGLKTAPSAGALYPLEIYVVAGNVTDLPAGVYKYKPEGHKLIKIADGDKRTELYKASLNQDWVKEAPASIIYSAVFSRTTDIYGKRGQERYVCMDLGHSAENVYLQAVSLNIGTVAIGAFYDTKVKVVVNMTKEEEPLYIMPIGKI
ncbi:MAG: SagB/ThcOx family dehydrogenase [Candidatus Cloacimonetes bacterium]|nr:SagB/ThcOx family dehydrogenase [Candidatus Cloacimonadota bacterium]